jgi:lysophospholipase L1-like esterase
MNTNPKAKVVLCYGDSNTHGITPTQPHGRYPADVRWTGQLQKKLGDDFYVIEEGLAGRTTNLDSPDDKKPGRNGFTYFEPCLFTHGPVDIVVITLGTNDLKNTFNRELSGVTDALEQYIDDLKEFDPDAKVVLVAPVPLKATEPMIYYDESSQQKSEQLASEISRLAKQRNVNFLDAGEVAKVGADGLHWDEPSQAKFAEPMAKLVRSLV